MNPLARLLRKQLEDAVIAARENAETAAHAAIQHLGVGEANAPAYLTAEEKALRLRLRAHGRALGDRKYDNKTQEIRRLIQEVAYEHWHTMLFARFLAENGLLVHPDGVPVSLADCQELARDEGVASGWLLAARYAGRMLPQVFRADSPVLSLRFAPEHQRQLEKLIAGLHPDTFAASDSLGWVYQYWRAKEKDAVNRSEVKIGADELPAVTQLFTEPYMVQFLLHNSLGAWWVSRYPDIPCPVELTYLRYAPPPQSSPAEGGGSNADAIVAPSPSMGEGESEKAMRAAGSSTANGRGSDAAVIVAPSPLMGEGRGGGERPNPAAGRFESWPNDLKDFKLLDSCCGSGHFLVAAFLMLVPMRMRLEALSARDAVDTVLRDNLHGLEIDQRCVEIAAFTLALEAWRYPDTGGYRLLPRPNLAWCGQPIAAKLDEWLALANGDSRLRTGMEALYRMFENAPLLGSLIDPRRQAGADLLTADFAELQPLLQAALQRHREDELAETAFAAQGMALAADLLSRRYHLVVTNVPYLTRGKQSDPLRKFCERRYGKAKNDLANVFLERCLELASLPSPSGRGVGGEGAGTVQIVMPQNWLFLTSYKKQREWLLKEVTWNLLARLGEGGFESSMAAGAFTILLTLTHVKPQADHKLRGLDASEPRTAQEKAALLRGDEVVAVSQKGQLANPDAKVSFRSQLVPPHQPLSAYVIAPQGIITGDADKWRRCYWEVMPSGIGWVGFQSAVEQDIPYDGKSAAVDWRTGGEGMVRPRPDCYAFGRLGVAISQMRSLPATLFSGDKFDGNIAPLIPKDEGHLPALWAFVSSSEFKELVRALDQKLNVTNGSFLQVPFDLVFWQQVATGRYPNGLPKPYSDDSTQWLFHGHPKPSTAPLQVAVARLLGYRWPAESDEQMELSDEARAWIAEARNLDQYSDDGIVCLPAIRGEPPAHERLLRMLEAAWDEDWTAGALGKLLADADCAGKSLEVWLRDKFFEQHCALFHQRPFIWQIWDGLRDGFAALVNYHTLDRAKLERLVYTYLGDWIRMQERAAADGVQGAVERLAAAQGLKRRLEAILEGEAPLDIFVRWKPIEQQPIGWEPDLNDGVRLNIRPFMLVDDVDKRGAGVLRARPNIHWNKDRGKDVESAPWYPLFKGDRINDHHLTLAEKRAAREQAR